MDASLSSVLIADDEEVVRLFMGRVLRELGYTADFAVDGKECLAKMSAGRHYDVLFLDLVMPRMDGESVLREVTNRYPATRVIIVSVQDDDAAIKELLAEGATAYLTKPITIEQIKKVMSQLEEMKPFADE